MLRSGTGEWPQIAEALVGREAELALLDRLLDESCAGAYRFVAVTGEPGIGKSALLGELTRRAGERGCLVLEGRATEIERELPFGLAVDTFDAYLESLDAQAYARLAADGLDDLASVFPSLRSLATGSNQPHTATERFRTHYAVRELIERLAGRQPVVLVFDDVHWSDGASLELLGHLLRRPAQAAVLTLVAYRTGRASPLRRRDRGRGPATEIKPVSISGPLAGGGRAAGRRTSPARSRWPVPRGGGNPFYLLQLARTATPRRLPRPPLREGRRRSRRRAGCDRDRARGLSAPVRGFVEAAAVAGDPFEFDLAITIAAKSDRDALDALDELIKRDLVRPADVPRRFKFRHPLVRTAVYEGCSPGARLAAHGAPRVPSRRAAQALRCVRIMSSNRRASATRTRSRYCAPRAWTRPSARPASAARWFGAALRILPGRSRLPARGRSSCRWRVRSSRSEPADTAAPR